MDRDPYQRRVETHKNTYVGEHAGQVSCAVLILHHRFSVRSALFAQLGGVIAISLLSFLSLRPRNFQLLLRLMRQGCDRCKLLAQDLPLQVDALEPRTALAKNLWKRGGQGHGAP